MPMEVAAVPLPMTTAPRRLVVALVVLLNVLTALNAWARPRVAIVSVVVMFGTWRTWLVVSRLERVRSLPVVWPYRLNSNCLVVSAWFWMMKSP